MAGQGTVAGRPKASGLIIFYSKMIIREEIGISINMEDIKNI